MNKIILELLKTKYPDANPEVLLELVENTPNPEVATEMLCGLYNEPEYDKTPSSAFTDKKVKDNVHHIEFLNYSKWDNHIYYNYFEKEVITIWNKKGDDVPTYDEVNNNKDNYLIGYWFEDINKVREQKLDKGDYEKMQIFGKLKSHKREGNTTIEEWNEPTIALPA